LVTLWQFWEEAQIWAQSIQLIYFRIKNSEFSTYSKLRKQQSENPDFKNKLEEKKLSTNKVIRGEK
jgi:hypothetical protein